MEVTLKNGHFIVDGTKYSVYADGTKSFGMRTVFPASHMKIGEDTFSICGYTGGYLRETVKLTVNRIFRHNIRPGQSRLPSEDELKKIEAAMRVHFEAIKNSGKVESLFRDQAKETILEDISDALNIIKEQTERLAALERKLASL